jgi:hypothetical protein
MVLGRGPGYGSEVEPPPLVTEDALLLPPKLSGPRRSRRCTLSDSDAPLLLPVEE